MDQIRITKDSYFTFSGDEVHCRLPDAPMTKEGAEIVCQDYTASGLMALLQHAEILRRHGARSLRLTYPYLPYARQDRVIHPDEPFSLKVFCDIINAQRFDSVTVLDPHSDVGPALLDRVVVVEQRQLALAAVRAAWLADEILFVSPDAGAYKKVAALHPDSSRIAIGVKHRGEKGKILHTDVFSPVPLEGRKCLIVDDICDGGRTFVELAKALKAKGVAAVALYVTHGIFSKGFDELSQHIDEIFTTNTILHDVELPPLVHVAKVIE